MTEPDFGHLFCIGNLPIRQRVEQCLAIGYTMQLLHKRLDSLHRALLLNPLAIEAFQR